MLFRSLAGYQLEHAQTRCAVHPADSSLARERVTRLARDAGVSSIDTEDIDSLRRGDRTVYVFDVRDPLEYMQGHRREAVSAPGGQLLQTLDAFVAVRNASIVVTDRDGVHAPVIAYWLKQMGYEDVFCAVDMSSDSMANTPPTPICDAIIAQAPKIRPDEAFALLSAKKAVAADLANSKQYRQAHIPAAMFHERHHIPELMETSSPGLPVIVTSLDGRVAAVVEIGRAHV